MSEYSYPLLNEEGKIICQICGKPFLVISPRHLGTHNIKYDEYKLRFPDAPLSSKEFNASSKYGKEKVLFVEKEMSKFEDETILPEEDAEDIIFDEEVLVDEEADIDDEMDLRKVLEKENKETDLMSRNKNKILDHLRVYFTNVEKDYVLRQYGIDNNLKFEFITDFCDPVLKIVIQFPDTFWHNREMAIDPNKNLKLKNYGWKVIEIHSNNPSLQEITSKINGL